MTSRPFTAVMVDMAGRIVGPFKASRMAVEEARILLRRDGGGIPLESAVTDDGAHELPSVRETSSKASHFQNAELLLYC